MAADIPNLHLLNTLFEPGNTGCFELNTSGELNSPAATYNAEAATTLSHSAGRELGNMLAALRRDFGQSGQSMGLETDFQARKEEIKTYQINMIVSAFGALFIAIDRATRLKIELTTVNEQVRPEKTELLEATENLVSFIENNLMLPFIQGFRELEPRPGSKTWSTILESMQEAAKFGSQELTQLHSNTRGAAESRYTREREAAITRIFAPATTD